jgi:rod shape-determining protein MreD
VRLIKVLLAITAIFLVQTMVLDRFQWLNLIDLFLLMNIYFALNYNQMVCMSISIPSGLIQDAFSKGIIGVNAFSKTIIVFLISGLSSRLMIKHPFIIMSLIATATLIDYVVPYGLYGLFHLPPFPLNPQVVGAAMLLNSLIGIILFQITDRIRSKKEYV